MRNELLQQFEGVVGQYHRDILNYIYRLVGNNYEAEDLAQETFMKAFQKFESLGDKEKARSWLYSIARNVTIDYFRKNKHRSIPLDEMILENYARATAVDFRDDVLRREVSQEVSKHVAALSVQDRMIVKLLYYEGFSYKEICDVLNINQNTLKSRLHRARKTLLAVMQERQLATGSLA